MRSVTDLIEFRSSPIHGLGGFARVPVPRGTRLLEYRGERIPKTESLRRCSENNACILSLDESWDLDGNVEGNAARFLNHSCAPNCDAELCDGRIWIVARRDLRPGEEITFDYGYGLEELEEHPCRCGAGDCVGFIVAEVYHDLIRRRRELRAVVEDANPGRLESE